MNKLFLLKKIRKSKVEKQTQKLKLLSVVSTPKKKIALLKKGDATMREFDARIVRTIAVLIMNNRHIEIF